MKKWFTVLLLITACFSLHAQSAGAEAQDTPEIIVYVAPVTGTGSRPDDNENFASLVIEKLEERNYTVSRTSRGSALVLYATLAPQSISDAGQPADDDSPRRSQGQMYILHLTLRDNRTRQTLINQSLFYGETEEIYDLIDLQFSQIPEASQYAQDTAAILEIIEAVTGAAIEESEDWRNKHWYFGAGAYWSPRTYVGMSTSTYYVNFGFSLSAEYNFIKFAAGRLRFLEYLSVGTGLEVFSDWVQVTDVPGDYYRDVILELPLVIKGVFRPARYFRLEPYAGINFNIPLYRDTKPPAAGWRAGFQYGVKAGPGVLFVDPWFSMDMGRASLRYTSDTYRRYMMHIGVGYKYGIGD